jgi:CHAD domain-containing protein
MNTLTSELSQPCLTVENFAKQTIIQFVDRISHYKVAVLHDTDLEPLHKMRVAMRRLRSILQLLEPIIILPTACNYRSIGKMATVLGSVRDLDVIISMLQDESYQHSPEYESLALKKVFTVLSHRRQKAFKKLRVCLDKEYQTFMFACYQWLEKPKYRIPYIDSQRISDVLPDLLLPKIATFFLHKAWYIIEKKDEKWELIIHDLRKSTKGIRYQLEYSSPYLNADITPFLPLLEVAQEQLGEMQDSLVMNKLLKTIIGKKKARELPELSRSLNEKTLQTWENWQSVKIQLCDQDWRRSLRMVLV